MCVASAGGAPGDRGCDRAGPGGVAAARSCRAAAAPPAAPAPPQGVLTLLLSAPFYEAGRPRVGASRYWPLLQHQLRLRACRRVPLSLPLDTARQRTDWLCKSALLLSCVGRLEGVGSASTRMGSFRGVQDTALRVADSCIRFCLKGTMGCMLLGNAERVPQRSVLLLSESVLHLLWMCLPAKCCATSAAMTQALSAGACF